MSVGFGLDEGKKVSDLGEVIWLDATEFQKWFGVIDYRVEAIASERFDEDHPMGDNQAEPK